MQCVFASKGIKPLVQLGLHEAGGEGGDLAAMHVSAWPSVVWSSWQVQVLPLHVLHLSPRFAFLHSEFGQIIWQWLFWQHMPLKSLMA